jgi:hypothetical protein
MLHIEENEVRATTGWWNPRFGAMGVSAIGKEFYRKVENLARVRPASKSKSNKSARIEIEKNGGEERGTYTQVVLVDVEAAELLVVPFSADGEGAGPPSSSSSGSWITDWEAPTTPRSLTTPRWRAHHRGHRSAGHECQGSGWRGVGGSPR